MAAFYNIYPQHSLIFIQVTGEQDILSFGEYIFQILDDPRCVPGMNTLLDCRESDVLARSQDEERRYNRFIERLTSDQDSPTRKVAVVAGSNLAAFGVSRMREVPLTDTQIDMQVFRETRDALIWLELSAGLETTLTTVDVIPDVMP